MTKVGRLFEEEKLEYANEKMTEAAKTMLGDGVDILTIMKATKLGKTEILKLENDFIKT